jgi:hypothetical protein
MWKALQNKQFVGYLLRSIVCPAAIRVRWENCGVTSPDEFYWMPRNTGSRWDGTSPQVKSKTYLGLIIFSGLFFFGFYIFLATSLALKSCNWQKPL